MVPALRIRSDRMLPFYMFRSIWIVPIEMLEMEDSD